MRVLVAAGGTGGHVYPALAIAGELRDAGHDVAFVGGDRIETRLVPEAGFHLTSLPGRGLPRRPSPDALRAAGAFARALVGARRLLRSTRPDVVVGMGGYPSLAPAIAAAKSGIALLLHEQNAMLSLANRLPLRRASVLALSLPLAGGEPRRARRIEHTGNPLRPSIRELAALDASGRTARRAEAATRLGLDPDRTTLLAFGGSLGAEPLNEALPLALADRRDELQVLHVSGPDHLERTRRRWEGSALDVHVLGYLETMEDGLAAADVACTRAGASTIAELLAVGLPSVLVPLPFAPGGVQAENAAVLERAGAGIAVPQGPPDLPGRLRAALASIVDVPPGRVAMADAARRLGRPDAAAAVARLVEGLASARR